MMMAFLGYVSRCENLAWELEHGAQREEARNAS